MRRLLPDPGPVDDELLAAAYRLPAGRSLRVNLVASPDGTVAVEGRSAGLGSPGDQRVFAVPRALADVVLVGHGTASAEGYGPMTADSRTGRLRVSLGRPATAPIAVVSGRASLEPRSRLALGGDSPTLLVTCEAADPARRAALADAGVTVLVCGRDAVDLPRVLDRLAGLGFERVLCEGGPQLLREALAAGVVDELDLSIAPLLVGAHPRLLDAALPRAVRLELRQLLEEDGTLFARYAVRTAG